MKQGIVSYLFELIFKNIDLALPVWPGVWQDMSEYGHTTSLICRLKMRRRKL